MTTQDQTTFQQYCPESPRFDQSPRAQDTKASMALAFVPPAGRVVNGHRILTSLLADVPTILLATYLPPKAT